LQPNQTSSNAAAALLNVAKAANRRPITIILNREPINMKPACDQTKHQEVFLLPASSQSA
jgi:hypothetical protein